jgi:hypothetical protein
VTTEPRLAPEPPSRVAPSIADLVRLFASTNTTAAPGSGAPSKRANKNRSGRRNIKTYQGRTSLTKVGGYDVSTSAAMAACIARPADTKMCVTYEEWLQKQNRSKR